MGLRLHAALQLACRRSPRLSTGGWVLSWFGVWSLECTFEECDWYLLTLPAGGCWLEYAFACCCGLKYACRL